ncbi:hypothetical protein BC829DRAFT_266455 [Chytridium lagenaria]|nr:hypothetical protein BC829DRAFT_266455 [Chytridium lagenaria]
MGQDDLHSFPTHSLMQEGRRGRRPIAPPGGGSSFSFGGYDETPSKPTSPTTSSQPESPATNSHSSPSTLSTGRRRYGDHNHSQWSFGGEEEEAISPLSHKKKFPTHSGGGRASIDLTGGGEAPISGRKVLQPIGGSSTISLTGEGGTPVKPSIRPLMSPGGHSSISLSGEGKPFDSYSIRPLQTPGGSSSISLTGEGEAPTFFERYVLLYAMGRNSSCSRNFDLL